MRAEGAWRHAQAKARAMAPRRDLAWSTILCFVAIAIAFALSHLMLEKIGIHYDTIGGTPLEKVAPATYIAILSLLALAWERGPENLLSDVVRRHPFMLFFALTWLLQLAYIVMRGGVITSTVDTFLFPMILLVILTRQDTKALHGIGLLIHAFMIANALLGIFEFVVQWRLTPIMAQGIEIQDWRASALLGQPLTNASATGCYTLVLMLGGGRDLPRWIVLPVIGLEWVAMNAFGGRAATAALVVATAIILLWTIYRYLTGKRFSLTGAAIMVFALPVLVAVVGIAIDAGALDKFIDRFSDDGGSAGSRVVMFDVIKSFRFDELLVGPDPVTLLTRQKAYGTEFGIENFWLAMMLYYGLITCIPFFIGLLLFMADIRRAARVQAWAVIVYFLFVCTSSLSIAGKTTMVGLMVAMIIVLLRPNALYAAAPAQPPQAKPRKWRLRTAARSWGRPGAFARRAQSI